MRGKGLAAALVMGAGFVAGVVYLMGAEFAAGEVYPEYSSLRSDPGGSKLLFDALAGVPGMTAARNYAPLDYVRESGATILLLGLKPESFVTDSEMQSRMERLARQGNRVVAAMDLARGTEAPENGSLYRNWEVKFGVDSSRGRAHRLYFRAARGWRVLDRIGDKTLGIERDFDKGAIVLLAASDDFSNQATVAADRLETVTTALGRPARVVFDESHFGIAESGSVVGLARRFRLTGMALGLALCAALFLWRSASAFPPPAAHGGPDRLAGRTAQAGLLTLLRRHIPPAELAAACWAEWLSANQRRVPEERLQKAAAIARGASHRPLEAVREIQAVLDSKGAL